MTAIVRRSIAALFARVARRVTALVPPSVALLCCAAALAPARAAELVVVDQDGCPYCERFEREIAPAWPNTGEGRRVPLRRVDLHGEWPADLAAVAPATLTPTFILVEDGREIGRLLGYPGDEHFWFLVGELLARLADAPGDTPAPPARVGEDPAVRARTDPE